MVQQYTMAGYIHTKNVEGYGSKKNLTNQKKKKIN